MFSVFRLADLIILLLYLGYLFHQNNEWCYHAWYKATDIKNVTQKGSFEFKKDSKPERMILLQNIKSLLFSQLIKKIW